MVLIDEGEGKKGGGKGPGYVAKKRSGSREILTYVIAAVVLIGVIVAVFS